MCTATTVSIATIMGDVGTMVTESIGWIGEYVGAIVSNPLLEMFVIVSFVGLGVGLIKRLIRL